MRDPQEGPSTRGAVEERTAKWSKLKPPARTPELQLKPLPETLPETLEPEPKPGSHNSISNEQRTSATCQEFDKSQGTGGDNS